MSDLPIPFRMLLDGVDPRECKLHLAVRNSEQAEPIEVLTGDPDGAWLDWNRYRPDSDVFNRRFVVSFAQLLDAPNRWLFGGIFEVVGRRPEPHAFSYDIERREDLMLSRFDRRLQVDYERPGRNIRLKLENALEGMTVAAVLAEPYQGRQFPGLDAIDLPFGELAFICRQQRPDWRGALENIKGVYVIRDRLSGRLYVGSAYADTGIWSRWGQYAESLHGNNRALVELLEQHDSDYAQTNLRISLLEPLAMRTPDDVVLRREEHWKTVLGTRGPHGLNRN